MPRAREPVRVLLVGRGTHELVERLRAAAPRAEHAAPAEDVIDLRGHTTGRSAPRSWSR
jgi:hypothetical protein